jgi:hypothetical protein
VSETQPDFRIAISVKEDSVTWETRILPILAITHRIRIFFDQTAWLLTTITHSLVTSAIGPHLPRLPRSINRRREARVQTRVGVKKRSIVRICPRIRLPVIGVIKILKNVNVKG